MACRLGRRLVIAVTALSLLAASALPAPALAAERAPAVAALQPDGQFGPGGGITRGEAATMLVRALTAN